MTPPFNMLSIAGSAAIAAIGLAAGFSMLPRAADPTELVTLPAATFSYRSAGEYLSDGQPVNAPLVSVALARGVAIMKNHVSRSDYELCVAAHACKPIDAEMPPNADATAAVGVNWYDAVSYAAWLSGRTGHHYRLPSDAEWAFAAANLFHDNMVVDEADAANPAKRWIATYESQAAADRPIDSRPQPFGTYGHNSNGLADVAGNIWDWTSTCFARHAADKSGRPTETESCGVRVVEGAHRTYLTDFVRNPKGGACSVGTPPNNLGIRLVRDDDEGALPRLANMLHRLTQRLPQDHS